MTEETVHESTEKRSRNRIASYLGRVARALGRGERVAVDEEQTVTVDPGAEPDLEIELGETEGTVSFEIGMEWEATGEDIETEVNASKATFEVYEDAEGKYRWRLEHDNGNIIADGSEGYASRQKAKQGLESVRRNAPGAHVVGVSRGTRRRRRRAAATRRSSCTGTPKRGSAGGSNTTTATSSPTAARATPRNRRQNRASKASGRTRRGRRSRRSSEPKAAVETIERAKGRAGRNPNPITRGAQSPVDGFVYAV